MIVNEHGAFNEPVKFLHCINQYVLCIVFSETDFFISWCSNAQCDSCINFSIKHHMLKLILTQMCGENFSYSKLEDVSAYSHL